MRETDRQSASATTTAAPSLDVVFDTLADRRRRYALYYLHDVSDGVATIDDVSSYIVARENSEHDPADHRRHVMTALRHVHVPKLEDLGVVEYDSRSETVRYWSQPTLEEWLEHARHKELS
ncbi:DUF7344 domain-containing protein [Natrononativus amylolyticus]|uniref:DUF7344 domain-containing protein n=1 Tax=Natrononativus amylolyticus TaxID=2963434 RepID=UPI0020CC50A6|nr:hypothetical protein [Natrononativus amylolyticus]